MAMIELYTQARSGTRQETLARKLQRLEMWLLLEATCAAITGLVPIVIKGATMLESASKQAN